jgi:hypothetical protein
MRLGAAGAAGVEDVVGAGGFGLQPRTDIEITDAETTKARTMRDEPGEVRCLVEGMFTIIVEGLPLWRRALICLRSLGFSIGSDSVRASSGLESR